MIIAKMFPWGDVVLRIAHVIMLRLPMGQRFWLFLKHNLSVFDQIIVIFCVGFLTVLFGEMIWRRYLRRSRIRWKGKHAFITGGSEGMGKALAILLARRGCSVTIVARRKQILQDAAVEIQDACIDPSQRVEFFTCDVVNENEVIKAVHEAQARSGSIDVLVTCAGLSFPKLFVDLSAQEMRTMMDVNYFGTVNAVKAVLPQMIEEERGTIVLVGSACSAITFAGFSAYSGSKYAVRGLADSLRNELTPYPNIHVHLSYPMDTKTPGYEKEQLIKDPICRQCSAFMASEFTADETMSDLIKHIEIGNYQTSVDPGFLLYARHQTGVSTHDYFFLDILMAPFMVIIGRGMGVMYDHIVRRETKKERKLKVQ